MFYELKAQQTQELSESANFKLPALNSNPSLLKARVAVDNGLQVINFRPRCDIDSNQNVGALV
ncbi:hypothetical protein [Endozoicomonas sp. SESOKO3]|uniref:hypothetical protein n=1 Tax=Endozoicomonas sp. SESOKO3 TaxID=2828744 RepID=UPI00214817D5|nr:hypothetical protein [Endozoicomonas sp. SESOKO3]